MNSFNKKLCALLLFNLFLIFSFCCSSFGADGAPVLDDLSKYTINCSIQPVQDLISTCENMQEVKSGDYYYFIGCYGYKNASYDYGYFLVKKSFLKNVCFKPVNNTIADGVYRFALACYVNGSWSGNYNDLAYWFTKLKNDKTFIVSDNVVFDRYADWSDRRDDLIYFITYCTWFPAVNDGTFYVPFASNYPYLIQASTSHYSDNINIVTARESQPYLSNSADQLSLMDTDAFAICKGNVESAGISFDVIDSSNDEVVLTLNLKRDYQDYVRRINLDDPFSSLGYVVALENCPDFTLKANTTYDFRVSYSYLSSTIYQHNFINVINGYTGGGSPPSSGGGDEGGNTTGGSTVTPEDERNQQLQNAIGESTDKIVESNKQTQEKIEEQTNAIKENTDTNKNIFEKIGDILSFLNPFSDNFFGKKLVDLIINGLKSLFVPEEGFFDEYFNSIRDWFSDRLGFLFAPFDFIIELLNRISNINFSEPIINIPDIKDPFTNTNLINKQAYNLNDLNSNEVFNNIHNIYLAGVDFIILIGLINLARKKIEEVFVN